MRQKRPSLGTHDPYNDLTVQTNKYPQQLGCTAAMTQFKAYDATDVVIRNASMNDIPDAVETFREVAAENIFLQTEEVPHETVGRWLDTWQSNGESSLFAVAVVKGKIIGGMVVHRTSNASKNNHVREIAMWLTRNYRGAGIGRRLVKYGLDWARKKESITKIILGVYSSNLRAIRLYLSMGFRIEGAVKDMALIEGRYVDEITMSLDLKD